MIKGGCNCYVQYYVTDSSWLIDQSQSDYFFQRQSFNGIDAFFSMPCCLECWTVCESRLTLIFKKVPKSCHLSHS